MPLGRQLRPGAEPLITSLPESITAPPGAVKWRNFGSGGWGGDKIDRGVNLNSFLATLRGKLRHEEIEALPPHEGI